MASIFSNFRFPTIGKIIGLVLIFITIRVTYYWMSDGFNVKKIENTFPITDDLQVLPPNTAEKASLDHICSQKFYYLAKGSQAYAFISQDKKYVLKLFKCYHLKPAGWLEMMPLFGKLNQMKDQALAKRQKKINTALNSYKIVSQMLQNECGLIYLQILPSSSFHQKVTIVDKIKREHPIDLANYGFIVQRRANLIYPKLASWIENKELDKAKKSLSSLIGLLVKRSLKGVQDSDPDLHKNAGFIGTDAIFIDLGSFHYNEAAKSSPVYMQDIRKITKKLHDWLRVQSPELDNFFEYQIQHAESLSWNPPA